ncbi:MAG TPA: hypothetical protein VJJ47_02465 [Candidatus Paceibacterota bacterium]
MTKRKLPRKHRTPPTLEGLAASIDNLSLQMMNGFSFFGERVGSLEVRMDSLEERVNLLDVSLTSKIEGLHRRMDDVVETRVSRKDLAATNKRVGRIEGHLKLA